MADTQKKPYKKEHRWKDRLSALSRFRRIATTYLQDDKWEFDWCRNKASDSLRFPYIWKLKHRETGEEVQIKIDPALATLMYQAFVTVPGIKD